MVDGQNQRSHCKNNNKLGMHTTSSPNNMDYSTSISVNMLLINGQQIFLIWESTPIWEECCLHYEVHIRVGHLIAATHSTCVFLSLIGDMHIVGPTLDLLPFFVIIGGV